MPNQNDRRTRANRENAQKSTGPRTTEGKTKSSMNALKHGLLAESVVVPDCPDLESQQQFNELHEALSVEYSPVGVVEQLLVETIAVSYWRLRRALRMEAAEIADKVNTHQKFFSEDPIGLVTLPSIKKTHMILRYETIIERRLNRATARLEQLQQKRKEKHRVAFVPHQNGGFTLPPDKVTNGRPQLAVGSSDPCAPNVRPSFNADHNQKQNEANPPQPHIPQFDTAIVPFPRTTPAGYPAYQAYTLPEMQMKP